MVPSIPKDELTALSRSTTDCSGDLIDLEQGVGRNTLEPHHTVDRTPREILAQAFVDRFFQKGNGLRQLDDGLLVAVVHRLDLDDVADLRQESRRQHRIRSCC